MFDWPEKPKTPVHELTGFQTACHVCEHGLAHVVVRLDVDDGTAFAFMLPAPDAVILTEDIQNSVTKGAMVAMGWPEAA
jgi:hypothetical protein